MSRLERPRFTSVQRETEDAITSWLVGDGKALLRLKMAVIGRTCEDSMLVSDVVEALVVSEGEADGDCATTSAFHRQSPTAEQSVCRHIIDVNHLFKEDK